MSDANVLRTSRDNVRLALAGKWPGRTLRGELVIDDGFVRDMVGIAGEAVPWSARQAVLRRLRHDLVVVQFSAGWGSPEQPDAEEALFLLRQWRDESDLFVFALMDGPFSAAAKAWRAQHPELERKELLALVRALWTKGVFELANVGCELLMLYPELLRASDMTLVEDPHHIVAVDFETEHGL